VDRKATYKHLVRQTEALFKDEAYFLPAAANLIAVLHEGLGNWWTGFYFVRGEELILGPFQGPVACTRIAKGKGVCGTAWNENRSLIVPDVHAFPGHIACSPASNAEIVVPFRVNQQIVGVLDLDSTDFNYYGEEDATYLSHLLEMLAKKWEGKLL
jgi:L-methionine (R)-S-oxide reductase